MNQKIVIKVAKKEEIILLKFLINCTNGFYKIKENDGNYKEELRRMKSYTSSQSYESLEYMINLSNKTLKEINKYIKEEIKSEMDFTTDKIEKILFHYKTVIELQKREEIKSEIKDILSLLKN